MSDHKRYINIRKYHFENMMHGYGEKNVPLKIARIYYSIATKRADEYMMKTVTDMDRDWAKIVANRDCSVKEILEIKTEFNNWIDEKDQEIA